MLRLGIPRESRWIDLGAGVRLKVKPTTTALVTAARLRAQRQLQDMRQAAEAARDVGLPHEGPDLSDQHLAAGYAFALTLAALAGHVVEAWEGVADAAGQPAPLSPAGLAELLAQDGFASRFSDAVMAAPEAIAAEGNG